MSTTFKIAKEIETEGMEFYEKLAAEAPRTELASVFTFLASAEKRHYELFDSLEKSMPNEYAAAKDSRLNFKELFQGLTEEFKKSEPALKALEDTEDAYQKALSFEQKSIDFYEKLQGDADSGLQKAIVGQLIAEEQYHARIIQGLLEFVRRPKEWVENAEFYHLDEY